MGQITKRAGLRGHPQRAGWLVSRRRAPFPLVTDGVESAVAQAAAVASNGVVGGIAAGSVQQRVNASLLDEIVINLAVLLGEGIRAAARGQPLRGDTDSIVAVWGCG